MRHVIAVLALAVLPVAAAADPPDTNVLIKGATIHDGTGKPGYKGDLLILKDRIADVGPAVEAAGATVIDGTGLVVCPGFIDLHTHCDSGLTTKTGKQNKNYVTQGCTTVITGNCGSGPVDAADYCKKIEPGGVGTT